MLRSGDFTGLEVKSDRGFQVGGVIAQFCETGFPRLFVSELFKFSLARGQGRAGLNYSGVDNIAAIVGDDVGCDFVRDGVHFLKGDTLI